MFHKTCKRDLRKLIQINLDDTQKIQSLNNQTLQLLSQIQELKAINDYQTFSLEKKIGELENELALLKSSKD